MRRRRLTKACRLPLVPALAGTVTTLSNSGTVWPVEYNQGFGPDRLINNERQYKITKNQLQAFEQAYAAALAKAPAPGVHVRIHRAMQDGLASEIEDLREQVKHYEDLKSGAVGGTVLTSMMDLLPALIEARIAAGLTQKALSERLGIAEQQVQRYEATTYAGVTIERVRAVADAVGLSINKELTYPVHSKA